MGDKDVQVCIFIPVKSMNKLLIISHDPTLSLRYAEELTEEGYDVIIGMREPIADLIAAEQPDLIVWDRDTRDEKSLLKAIGKASENIPVIFGLDRVPLTSGLPQHRQSEYFIKRSDLEELKIKVKRLLRPQNLPIEDIGKLGPFSNAPASQLNLGFFT